MSYTASPISGKAGGQTNGVISTGSKITLTTSLTDVETKRGAVLSFYHAFNCGAETCEYAKAGKLEKPSKLNTTYTLDFPAVNPASDRLIMDTRDAQWMKIANLKFTNSNGDEYNLLDFNVAESGTKLNKFYSRYKIENNDEPPCGFKWSRNQVRLTCYYDFIFDLASKTVHTEKPLIEGI